MPIARISVSAIIPAVAAAAALALLGGCAVTPQRMSDRNASALERLATCAGSSSPTCLFRNSPVRLEQTPVTLPGRALTFYPTAEELAFVDAKRRNWVAPPKTLTDGASIPKMFISIIGDPKSREFANAAAVHDAYCGVGNERGPKFHTADWRSVHRMFYDALRVGGTPEQKAKVMYAAVYLGGPRWTYIYEGDPGAPGAATGPGVRSGNTAGRSTGGKGPSAGGDHGLGERAMRRALRRTISFIEADNPTLPQIEAFADAQIAKLQLAMSAGEGAASDGHDYAEQDYGEDGGVTDPNEDPATGLAAPGTPATTDPAAGTGTAAAIDAAAARAGG